MNKLNSCCKFKPKIVSIIIFIHFSEGYRWGYVIPPLNSFNLEILNQKNIFEDGYDEFNSYDDCILNHVANIQHDTNIKDILKPHKQKRITDTVEEPVLRHLSNLLEYTTLSGICKVPNLKLQVGFKLTSLDFGELSVFEKKFKDRIVLGLEFPSASLVREVKYSYFQQTLKLI